MSNCEHCGGKLRECKCLTVEAGSNICLGCGQGGNLPKPGQTRPVPHSAFQCRDTLAAAVKRLRDCQHQDYREEGGDYHERDRCLDCGATRLVTAFGVLRWELPRLVQEMVNR